LLRTIKLTKNVFKLTLPSATYNNDMNYQTMPVEKTIKRDQNSRSRLNEN